MPSKFWYYGLSKEDYKKCLPLIRRDNFRMDRYGSYIGFVIMLILFAVSFAYDKLDVFKWIYGGFAGGFLVLSVLSLFFRKHDEAGVACYYLIASIYIAFGVLLSTSYPPGKATIIYIELLFFSVFFTDKTIRAWIYILLAGGVYILCIFLFKDPSIQFEEFYNAVCITILSLGVNWLTSKSRLQGYLAQTNYQITIKNLETTKKALQTESTTDALTGLNNRRHLYEVFTRIKNRTLQEPSGMLIIDLDHFKDINDRYGHLEGDKALKNLGDIFQKIGKESPVVFYRYGGDEFVALVYGTPKKEGVAAIADKIEEATTKVDVEGERRLTVSIGWTASSLEDTNDMEAWLDHADRCVYKAKDKGRNQAISYSKK